MTTDRRDEDTPMASTGFADRLDFLRRLDDSIAQQFLRAAQLCFDVPASAANALRIAAEVLVKDHLHAAPGKKCLFDLIADLRAAEGIPKSVCEGLDHIRELGNDGSHPRTPESVPTTDRVLEALPLMWRIAEWLHERDGGRPEEVPAYVPPTPADGAAIFHDAVIGGPDGVGEPAAKYHVAMALKAQQVRWYRELRAGKRDSYAARDKEILELHWAAEHAVPAARTEIAKLTLERRDVARDDVDEALALLASAAEDDESEALFYLGAIHLEGRHGQALDVPRAVALFERAVVHEDPRAFNALAVLYRDGDGELPGRARDYARRSAEAGFPTGQLQYGIFLVNGVGGAVDVERGWTWIRRAANQGWSEATFVMAVSLIEGRVEPAPDEDGEQLLESACRDRCVDALRWRARRQLNLPDSRADFARAFIDLVAAEDVADDRDRDALRAELIATHQRLEAYLRTLPKWSEPRCTLSCLWSCFNADGTRRFNDLRELQFQLNPFVRVMTHPSGAHSAEAQTDLWTACAGPGVTDAEIERKVAGAEERLKRDIARFKPRGGVNGTCGCGSGLKYKKCHGSLR